MYLTDYSGATDKGCGIVFRRQGKLFKSVIKSSWAPKYRAYKHPIDVCLKLYIVAESSHIKPDFIDNLFDIDIRTLNDILIPCLKIPALVTIRKNPQYTSS